jgi:hypothetical protein
MGDFMVAKNWMQLYAEGQSVPRGLACGYQSQQSKAFAYIHAEGDLFLHFSSKHTGPSRKNLSPSMASSHCLIWVGKMQCAIVQAKFVGQWPNQND